MNPQKAEEVKEKILSESFAFLVKHGIEGTSIRDLCKGTGISSGSVYYWFENKEELFIHATEYGLLKTSEKIFEYAERQMGDLDKFFSSIIDEISKYKAQLRFVYQLAASPYYGERMRRKADILSDTYEKCADALAKQLSLNKAAALNIVYLTISIVLNYIVWEDVRRAKEQLEYIYNMIKLQINTNK